MSRDFDLPVVMNDDALTGQIPKNRGVMEIKLDEPGRLISIQDSLSLGRLVQISFQPAGCRILRTGFVVATHPERCSVSVSWFYGHPLCDARSI